MPRNIESGPVQEEPEQQINLEGENSDTHNKREKTQAEKISELDHLISAANDKFRSAGDRFKPMRQKELDLLIAQRDAMLETEVAKAQAEKLKVEAEMKAARQQIDRAFGENNNR